VRVKGGGGRVRERRRTGLGSSCTTAHSLEMSKMDAAILLWKILNTALLQEREASLS
jgi:hypothetical protein